jgi:hypothetical protein
MSSNNNASVPASAYGLPPQTLAPPPPGSDGSIYSNAAAISKNNAEIQNKSKFGGSRRKLRGGAASITVPPVSVPYKEAGAGNNTTSANITNSTKVQADLYAAKQYDACVGSSDPSCGQQAGGKKRKLKGGWPAWRCMSGGKSIRKSRGKCRKSRKTRKCRRRKSK